MNPTESLPRELEDKVMHELESGERVLWMAQPIPRYFTAASTGAFLFAIPWTAFAIFWICGAAGFRIPDFSQGGFSLFPLFGVPFVLIGIAMLSSPVWSYRKAFKTVYVITDRRAITFDAGWTTTIRSYPLDRLQNIYRIEKRDGSGDVVLGQSVRSGSEETQQAQLVGFMNIREPKQVEQMLKKLAESPSALSEQKKLIGRAAESLEHTYNS
ncbi:MAG: hypothetical protein HC887_09650 [Desulfobacteraceae bacterium]|nr:hypothetical protein [Desulfobacteraceae bacterium]